MNHFRYSGGVLHAEGVDLNALAEQVGTPFYCYSSATLERHFKVFADSFAKGTLVAFSVKALGNVAVLKTLARLGAGADPIRRRAPGDFSVAALDRGVHARCLPRDRDRHHRLRRPSAPRRPARSDTSTTPRGG